MYSYVTFFFVYSGMYWYVILLVCTRMFLAYTHMLLVCPRLSSYVLACYLYLVLITIWVNSKFIVTQKRCFLLLNCHERRQLSFKSHTELQDFEDYACKQMTHFDVVIFLRTFRRASSSYGCHDVMCIHVGLLCSLFCLCPMHYDVSCAVLHGS